MLMLLFYYIELTMSYRSLKREIRKDEKKLKQHPMTLNSNINI